MPAAERNVQNFRSNYYHRLGTTTTVEEKKNLRKLLENDPVDLKKLEQFCLRLHVPCDYRLEIWKTLLRISPEYRNTIEYVAQQRTEHYTELHKVAQLMRGPCVTDGEDMDVNVCLDTLLIMYLIEKGVYLLNMNNLESREESYVFCRMVTAMYRYRQQIGYSLCDIYWISRNFSRLTQENIEHSIPQLTEHVRMHIQKEDNGNLLAKINAACGFESIPFQEWFRTCFATVLPDCTFERIWDKVMAGSSMVLAFVAVAMIVVNKRPIQTFKKSQDLASYFRTEVSSDTAELVVGRGIELWQRYGSRLTPCGSKSSPSPAHDRPAS